MKTNWIVIGVYLTLWFIVGICAFVYEKGAISPLILIGGVGAGGVPVVAYLHGLVSSPPADS